MLLAWALAAQGLPAAAAEGDRALEAVDAQGEAEPAAEAPAAERDPTSFSTSVPRRSAEPDRAADLVQAAPGAVVRDLGVNQPATVSLRGSTPDQVVVLLDGVPLNPAAGGGADLSLVPVAFVDRISVVRGAVGARYGGGAVGGALSLSTRPPAKDGEREVYGQLSYGSFSTLEGSAGLSFSPGKDTSLLLTGFGLTSKGDFSYLHSYRPLLDDPDDLVSETRENNEARRGGGLLRVDVRGPVEGSALVEVDGGERGVPGTVMNPTPDDRQQDVRGLGVGKLAFFASGVRFEARLVGRLSRLQLWSREGDGTPQDESLATAEVSASKLLGRNAVEIGVIGGRESLGSQHREGHERFTFGAWACDEISFSFLSLVPALRYERVADMNGFSPKLGASVPLGEYVSIKANAGRSFRAPSFGELYLEQGAMAPNPTLQPETGTQLDLGPEVRVGPLTASLAGYWGLYEDLILYELYAPMRSKPYNFGRAEVWGGELAALFQKGPITASAAYTLAFSVNRLDEALYLDKELPYHPRHRLHARLAAEWWRLEGHVEADVQSEQYTNRTNQTSRPGHAHLDLGASAVLDREVGLSLHAAVQNLFDDRTDFDLYGYPLPGRAFTLALRFDSNHRSNP